MDYSILKVELTDDPLTRNYAGMSDEAAAADLNDEYQTRDRTSMSASEVLNVIDKVAFNALGAVDKQLIWDLLHIGAINPFGIEAELFVDVFGAGSPTITALQVLRVESISRATELGLGLVKVGHVQKARE